MLFVFFFGCQGLLCAREFSVCKIFVDVVHHAALGDFLRVNLC